MAKGGEQGSDNIRFLFAYKTILLQPSGFVNPMNGQ